MLLLLLILLILIPIFAYRWAATHCAHNKFIILGIAFGSIVAPFSMGLYATFFIPLISLPTGLLGLVMVMLHSGIGFQVAIQSELIPSGVVTNLSSNIIIAIINGFAWGAIYGVIGYFIDKYRKHKQNPNPNKALKRDAEKASRPLT